MISWPFGSPTSGGRKERHKGMFITFKIWRLHRQRRHFAKIWAGQDAEKQEEIWGQILQLKSSYLSAKAEKLGIPVPPSSDEQSWVDAGRGFHLTVEAQLELKRAIRNEQREKWGLAAFMLKEIAAPLVGSIGAIMGLLSLIHSFKSK